MLDRASQILDCLMDAPVITVEPGFTVDARTSYGVCDDDDDLALTVEWRDAEGCIRAADFSEAVLARAKLRNGAISLRDTDGAKFVFQLYQPARQIAISMSGPK